MPSPYMTDLFDAMNGDPRIRLRVLYLESAAPDTHWADRQLPEYATVLSGRFYWFRGARLHDNPGVVAAVAADPGDVTVVVGYAGLSQQRVQRWLNRTGRPWVFMGEIPGLEARNWLGRRLRSLAQKPLRKASAIAAVGSHAASHYASMIGDRMPVVNIPYVCDLTPFSGGTASARNGETRFLYCGQIIPRKGVDCLLQAFTAIASRYPGATLTLVGEGPFREQWQSQLSATAVNQIRFAGFQQIDQLPPFFHAADVFVLPSRHDGWGVVVNQAIGAGLPVIVTAAVGASNDLVEQEGNGFVIDAQNADQLESAMERFLIEPALIESFSQRSRQIADEIKPAAAVEKWYQLLSQVTC